MSDLSILCVTKGEKHVPPFIEQLWKLQQALEAELVLVLDGESPETEMPVRHRVHSRGNIESVLDEAVAQCSRKYVLRLDDDERATDAMRIWLLVGAYSYAPHWKFPRAHLWRDEYHMLLTPDLWPDHQTRLSLKEMSGGRRIVHAGSPFGGGQEAPVVIEHHKFLVRTLEERREMIARYDSLHAGAGSNFRAFNTPEDFYTEAQLAEATVDWNGCAIEEKEA